MMEFNEVLHLDCSCSSPAHTLRFYYEKEEEDYKPEDRWIVVDVNLPNHRGFWKRLWWSIRYTFGHKSQYGPFDEFVMTSKNAIALKEFLEEYYSNTKASE